MRKLIREKTVLLTLVGLFFLTGLSYAIDIACEIMPGDPEIKRIVDDTKPQNALAGKLWWHPDKKMYIRQIILYNDTPKEKITKEIYQYVMSLNPKRYTGIENFGYKLWPSSDIEFDFSKFKQEGK